MKKLAKPLILLLVVSLLAGAFVMSAFADTATPSETPKTPEEIGTYTAPEGAWKPGAGEENVAWATWNSEADYLAGKHPKDCGGATYTASDVLSTATVGNTVASSVHYVHLFADAKCDTANQPYLSNGQALTINLGGNQLTMSKGFRVGNSSGVNVNASLTIKNGTLDQTGGQLQTRSNSTVNITNCIVKIGASASYYDGGSHTTYQDCNITVNRTAAYWDLSVNGCTKAYSGGPEELKGLRDSHLTFKNAHIVLPNGLTEPTIRVSNISTKDSTAKFEVTYIITFDGNSSISTAKPDWFGLNSQPQSHTVDEIEKDCNNIFYPTFHKPVELSFEEGFEISSGAFGIDGLNYLYTYKHKSYGRYLNEYSPFYEKPDKVWIKQDAVIASVTNYESIKTVETWTTVGATDSVLSLGLKTETAISDDWSVVDLGNGMVKVVEHKLGEATMDVIEESTCTTSGSYTLTSTCKVCGEAVTQTVETPAKGHIWGEDDLCTECGIAPVAWDPATDKTEDYTGITYGVWESEFDYAHGLAPKKWSKSTTLTKTDIATQGSADDDYLDTLDFIPGYVHLFANVTGPSDQVVFGTEQNITFNLNEFTYTDVKGFRLGCSSATHPNSKFTLKNGTWDRGGSVQVQGRQDTTMIFEDLTIKAAGSEFMVACSDYVRFTDCNITCSVSKGMFLNLNSAYDSPTKSQLIIENTQFTGNGASAGFMQFVEAGYGANASWTVTIDGDCSFTGSYPLFVSAKESWVKGNDYKETFVNTQTIIFEDGVQFSRDAIVGLASIDGGMKYSFTEVDLAASKEAGSIVSSTAVKPAGDSNVKIDFVDENGDSIIPTEGKWYLIPVCNVDADAKAVVAVDYMFFAEDSKAPIVAYNADGNPYLAWSNAYFGVAEDKTTLIGNTDVLSDGKFQYTALVLDFLENNTTLKFYEDIYLGGIQSASGKVNLTIDLNGHKATKCDKNAFQLGYKASSSWNDRTIRIISSADKMGYWYTGANHCFQPRPGSSFYAENVEFDCNLFTYGTCVDMYIKDCIITSRNGAYFCEGTAGSVGASNAVENKMDLENREYRTIIFDNTVLNDSASWLLKSPTADGLDIVFMNGCVINNTSKRLLIQHNNTGAADVNLFFDLDTKFDSLLPENYYSVKDPAIQTVNMYFYSDITEYRDVAKNGAIVTEGQYKKSDLYAWTNNTYYYYKTEMAPVSSGDLQANLTLYTDFNLNFFVNPEVITSILYNGEALTSEELDGVIKYVLAGIAPNVAADDLTFDVTVKYGEEYCFVTLNYSVLAYANAVMAQYEDGSFNEQFISAVMNYVKAAYAYTGKTAPEFEGTEYTPNRVAEAPALPSAIAGASYDLTENFKLRFTLAGDFTGTLKIADYSFEVENGKVGGVNYVTIELRAYELYKGVNVTTVTEEGAVENGTYDLGNYLYFANSSENQALIDLVNALYDYSMFAAGFKKAN